MNVVIVGMGIIGGSFAKAIKKYTNHTVIGINRSEAPLNEALAVGAIDKIGTELDLENADLIILCTFPNAAINFIKENAVYIKKHCVVTDAAGIKSKICPTMVKLARENNFIFVGSHPMAGKEKNGFGVSDADLFLGASYIIVPCEAPRYAVNVLYHLALQLGFGGIRITTPEEHDKMIAFTSQLPHALACAYVLSPSCPNHNGFSAGSYRDVSRVANINAQLWSELFLENKEPLLDELGTLIENLTQIKNSIELNDEDKLRNILKRGKAVKEALGE
ncbi:MAG TPA: prephenate dehydrogenase [Clostridiales bacterium]|nr:prephenate dehydrogenase [Clostridiales bacterium]